MDQLFTQKDGFVDYEVPERLRWKDKEEWEDYQKRLEIRSVGTQDQADAQEYGARVCVDFTPGAAVIYHIASATGDEPLFLVEVNAVGLGAGHYMVVWVKTLGDLLALRIQLAHLLQIEALGALADVRTLLKRFFRVFHNHDPWRACRECDPQEFEVQQREEQQRLEAMAKERVFYLLDRKDNRVFIRHALTEEAIEKYFQAHQKQRPNLVLAASTPGTTRHLVALSKKFRSYCIKPGMYAASPELLRHINLIRESRDQRPVNLIDPST